MHSSYAFTLPFKAHWLRAPWSIFRLYVAKLKCGDECQREGFVPGCSNTACPFSERLSSRRERQSCLFCPGTMGRLVVKVEGWPIRVWLRHHEALISKGVEGYLLPPVLNRGVEGQSSSVVMVEGSDTCRHQKRWLPLSMSEVSHRNSFLLKSKNITQSCLHCLGRLVSYSAPLGLFLHMVSVVEISLASLRIPHTSIPPLGIHCETMIWMRAL